MKGGVSTIVHQTPQRSFSLFTGGSRQENLEPDSMQSCATYARFSRTTVHSTRFQATQSDSAGTSLYGTAPMRSPKVL